MLRFAAATVSNTPIYSFWTRTLPSQQHHRLRWASRRAGKRGRPTCRCQARRRTPNRPPPAPSHCRRTPGPRSDGCVCSSTVRRRCLPFDMPASSHLVLLQPLVEVHMARQHGGSLGTSRRHGWGMAGRASAVASWATPYLPTEDCSTPSWSANADLCLHPGPCLWLARRAAPLDELKRGCPVHRFNSGVRRTGGPPRNHRTEQGDPVHRFHLDKLNREWCFWPSGFVEAWGTKQNPRGLQCQNHWPLIHPRVPLIRYLCSLRARVEGVALVHGQGSLAHECTLRARVACTRMQ